jgi:deazaflavin-dependent oxidoreductase (nitroreductase family)
VKLQRFYNPLVIWLLRSPLHALMSGSVLLLTFEGRRSSRTYTTPISYVREGEDVLLVAARDHSWWKNLRGGAPVRLRISGRNEEGIAEALEDASAEEALLAVLRAVPAYRRHWKVELGPDGRPTDPNDLVHVAKGNVPVRIRGLTAASRT